MEDKTHTNVLLSLTAEEYTLDKELIEYQQVMISIN